MNQPPSYRRRLRLAGQTLLCLALSGGASAPSAASAAELRSDPPPSKKAREVEMPPSEGAALLSTVRAFVHPDSVQRPVSDESRRFLRDFYQSIQVWSRVLAGHFAPVPGHPDWGYYGLEGNTENEIRPITYAVQVNAFLSAVAPPGGQVDMGERERCQREAIAALRYLTSSHVTGGGRCLNGKPWGNVWQSAMWARSAGLGGWMLWPHLDEPMRQAVARLVEFEADRILIRPPRDQEFSNTGAEENAWDALITSLAANMLPRHPRAAAWDHSAKLYLYNSLSRRADQENTQRGDDGRPVRDWVNTVNAHPDFTVENHGLVHVGYLKLTVGEMLENAQHYLLAGAPVPQACFHNTDGAFQVLLRCMSWDGAPISFGGNDWKIVHTQCTDIVIYTYLSLLRGDAVAAYLERVALDTLRSIQKQEGGFYNVRRDLEYGGFCASRLVACYLAHAFRGETTAPVSAEAFNQRASGVLRLEQGDAILHRTPTKFASFTWGPNRMALALPTDGTWVIWPHYASYLGVINGRNPSRAEAELEKIHHVVESDRFGVCGRLVRKAGNVTHEFAYASLARDLTVYVERLRTSAGGSVKTRETGIIGHGYPLQENERTLRGRHGSTRVIGIGGGDTVTAMPTDWLNLGERIGYVVRRGDGRANVMRYHGEERGSGRVPLLQEYLSLVGEANHTSWPGQDWACIVTFLNQSAAETARWAEQPLFFIEGATATCRLGRDTVRVDFGQMEISIHEPGPPARGP